ncbi:subtilisin-like protease SBT3.1 [Zingiber officinale]|uniref:subtilisin-like protease SBT3.1 n=1 Tax=Zingiber officinale TaxID=94328 RepID=UPI001C4CAF38|nr:subtilisin-like protease SBT3.1 [Zingiber officinale]
MAKPTLFPIAFALLLLLFLSSLSASETAAEEKEDASVYIVFVEEPAGEEPEAFHIRTLAAVLGSEEAAEQAILFHYTHAAYGFAAKLTPKQAEKLKKQPGVLEVMPSRTYSIHDPTTSASAQLSVI